MLSYQENHESVDSVVANALLVFGVIFLLWLVAYRVFSFSIPVALLLAWVIAPLVPFVLRALDGSSSEDKPLH